MWKVFLSAAALCIAAAASGAQDFMGHVLYLTGAGAEEELGEEVLERFEALASRPVKVNLAPVSRLVSCGLFSRYQAASIEDYRRSSGDILSVQELALLDGFGEEAARVLEPFVSFETRAQPGRSSLEGGRVSSEALGRWAMTESEGETSGQLAVKLRTGDEDRWLLSAAAKGSGGWPPEALSASAVVYARKLGAKLILGDFNTRYGQGLLLWSGFSLSGVQSAAAMDRHPSGLSQAWTLSPGTAHRGAAADCTFGRIVLGGFFTMDRMAGINATWLARHGQVGATALSAGRASLDWRWSFGKIDTFGEAALDAAGRVVALVAGGAWNAAYQVRLAASVRSYPAAYAAPFAGALRSSTRTADERGAALALDYKSLTVTVDHAAHPSKGTSQSKSVMKYSPQITDHFAINIRAVSRYRPMDAHRWRNDLRAETLIGSKDDGLSLKISSSLCRSTDLSWLAYLELGYRKEKDFGRFQAYVRGTAFKVDSWEDRIYVYERDVPGAFSVPAYYGRGCSASAVASLKGRHVALHARAYATAYPGMGGKKPGKAGLKLQCQVTF